MKKVSLFFLLLFCLNSCSKEGEEPVNQIGDWDVELVKIRSRRPVVNSVSLEVGRDTIFFTQSIRLHDDGLFHQTDGVWEDYYADSTYTTEWYWRFDRTVFNKNDIEKEMIEDLEGIVNRTWQVFTDEANYQYWQSGYNIDSLNSVRLHRFMTRQ